MDGASPLDGRGWDIDGWAGKGGIRKGGAATSATEWEMRASAGHCRKIATDMGPFSPLSCSGARLLEFTLLGCAVETLCNAGQCTL